MKGPQAACYDDAVMAHPDGGSGATFLTHHSFSKAYDFVGTSGVEFPSETGENITARQGTARDAAGTKIISFTGTTRHGAACHACWGFRSDCSGSWIGQCAEALDKFMGR